MTNGTTLVLTISQIALLKEFSGDDDTLISIVYWHNGHSGKGMYAYATEYPEEGAIFLGNEQAA